MSSQSLPTLRARTLVTPEIRRYFEIVAVLAARSLQSRYRGSVLGVYWSLSNPLIMTLVYTGIFGSAFAKYYNNSIGEYLLACLTGLVVINFFAQTTAQALQSVVSNGGLLNKIRVPVSAFPTSMVAANVFQLLVGTLPLVMIVTLVRTHNPISTLLVIVPFAALVLVAAGFSFALAALFVYFRDLPYLWEVVSFILWITSPIFYSEQVVPEQLRTFLAYNPLAIVIAAVRHLALGTPGSTSHLLGAAVVDGLVVFGLGWLAFRGMRKDFMDLI